MEYSISMESNGHPPQHHFNVSYVYTQGTSPDNLVIHFHYHIVHRYSLVSAAGVVIEGPQDRTLYDQRSAVIPKKLVLNDIDEAYQIVSHVVSQFCDDAHVSFDWNFRRSLQQQIVTVGLVVAMLKNGQGMDVSIDTIEDHLVSVDESVGDGMEKETVRGVEGDGESCVICMEELPRGTQAVRMPCSHVFHGACIGRWLGNSHHCPVCRYEMRPVRWF